MTKLLCRMFVKNREDVTSPTVRQAYGTMVSGVGIVLNLFLSAFKFLAGMLSGSIAITADAVNNLSDAASQLISLITFKISAKPADRDHPFGHARIEYVASMIVSFLILHVGTDLLRESVIQIFNPTDVSYSNLSLVILGVSVAFKLWLAVFNRKIGKKINSSVVTATSTDSLMDAVATGAVLLSAILSRVTELRTDAYMGVAVAGLIFVAGARILIETKNSILGSAPDPEVVESIVALTKQYPEILGVHDMVVHNYGPGNTIASFHAEVDGAADVFRTHDVIDMVEKRIWSELGIRATVHMDPIVTDDERVTALRGVVAEKVLWIDERLTIHDFRFVEGPTHTNLIFDVCAPFELSLSDEEIKRAVSNRMSHYDPNYFCVITVDRH